MEKAIIHGNLTLDYAGSEAINTVSSNLTFAGENIKRIVVTSCEANDGKSFVAILEHLFVENVLCFEGLGKGAFEFFGDFFFGFFEQFGDHLMTGLAELRRIDVTGLRVDERREESRGIER